MKLKTIFGIILGIVAVGLTSCSSDLTNGENTAVNPNETAERALSLSTENAKTRSEVNLTTGNKWVSGDKFLTYNVTFTGLSTESRTAILTASGQDTKIQLRGHVACKNNDKLAVFYPGMYSSGFEQYESSVIMDKSRITEKGQDGTEDNLKDFDYSFGTATLTVDGNSASGSVDMKKLYAVLKLDFKFKGDKLHNIKKVVLSNVIREKLFDLTTGQLKNPEVGSIEINTPSNKSLDEVYVVVLPQNDFKPKIDVTTADNKIYTYSITSSGVNIEAAKVYPVTVEVKKYDPNPPYIEINGIRWGKSNLQYTPSPNAEGWRGGFHLAQNPWDYFYTQSNPMIEQDNVRNVDDNSEFDHFRWGDISYAYDYSYNSIDVTNHYDKSSGSIMKKNENNEFGDLPYYASNGNWRLPTQKDYEDLMSHTAQYIGYYSDGTNDILGVLFVPKPSDPSEIGYTVTKNGKTNRVANSTATLGSLYKSGWDTNYKKADSKLIKFTKEDISKGLFFPAAGWYLPDSKKLQSPGRQGTYWTADGKNTTQAVSFTFSFNNQGQFTSSVGKASYSPTKRCLYSIRPIYIGD